MKTQDILNQIEANNIGFFTRLSDGSLTIFIRGAHGNDPSQWHNARQIENALGTRVMSTEPDAMSGHIVIRVRTEKRES